MDRRSVSLQACIDDIKNHQPQQVITNPVELFQARLNSFRLRVECVTQDHEVGFRVLSFSVFGRETAYDLMKNLVYNQIQSNQNLYEPLINKDGHDFNNYCQQLLTGPLPAYEDCTWMQAVSDLFRVTLRILWDDQRVIFTEISPLAADRQVLSMKTLWLGCSVDFSWFQPLVPLNFSVQPSIDDPYVKFYNLMALYNQPSFNDMFEVCHRIFSHLSSTRVPKNQYRRHSLRIKEFNFERIAVDGDGNCCFRTLSFLLSKTDDYHDLVRALAVLQIRSNPGRYQSLCVLLKPPEVKVPETLDRYLIRMAKLGTWGDDGCIQAIVDLCRIKITDLNSQMHVLFEYVPQGFYYKEGFICRNTHHMEPLLPTADFISQVLLAKSMSRCNFSGYMTRCLSRGYLNEVSDKAVSSLRQNMDKTRMNFVVIGPENSGKSTTTGHLIYKLGGVAKSLIDELENDCAKMDRPSYQYAWVLDTLKAERERRCTIDISSLKFETPRFSCTAVDAPGKNCFIKNLIAGTSQADCAVLVIDSSTNAFKADQSGGKQMREHALLAFTFGVRQIICCCNKMDETIPKYSEERYNEIVNEVQFNLKDVGYKPEGIHFVPVSGFWGENLTDRSSDIDLDWYKGPTLVETIDSLSEPKRPSGMPLRLPICGAYNIPGIGTVPVGRVESGILKSGMEVTFGPTGLTAKVNSIQMHGKEVVEAMPGDIVSFSLQNASQNVPGEVVKRGYVASNSFEDPVKGARSFVAQVIIINPFGKIENNYTPVIHCHTSYGAAKFTLLNQIDRRTGKESETRPMSLIVGDCAIVKLTLKKPMVVEPFMEYPPLGWFAARDMDRTVAVGVIKSVDKMYP